MRFISPKTDFAFKKIFGSSESKDILISFLNALIYKGNPVIEDLEIIDPYNPGSVVDLKDTYLDVRALLDDGTTAIVEMQILNVAAFEKRVAYNLAKTYANQLKAGEGYSQLNPVIALTITDFIMFDETQRVITRFVFQEKEELFEYRDRELEMVFVELPKFTKNLEALTSLTDKWIYFIKDAPSLDMIPPTLSQVQEIEKALNIANQANLSVQELEKIQKREMFVEDQRGYIVKAKQEEVMTLVMRLLDRKFETVPTATITELKKLSLAQLEQLIVFLMDLTDLEGLSRWLRDNISGDR